MTFEQLQNALARTEREIVDLKVQGKFRYGGNHKSGHWPTHEIERLHRLKHDAQHYRALLESPSSARAGADEGAAPAQPDPLIQGP